MTDYMSDNSKRLRILRGFFFRILLFCLVPFTAADAGGAAMGGAAYQGCMAKERAEPLNALARADTVSRYCTCSATKTNAFMASSPVIQQALKAQDFHKLQQFITSPEWQRTAAEFGLQCRKEVQGNSPDAKSLFREDAPKMPNTPLSDDSRKSFMIGIVADCMTSMKEGSRFRHYKDTSLREICNCAAEKVTANLTYADVQKMVDKTSPAAKRFQKAAEKHGASCTTKVLSQ